MTLDDLLARHTDDIADLARRLLDLVDGAADWAETRVYAGWHGVGFHHADAGYVVGVFPRRDAIQVLFEHGHLLGDAPFLDGSGQTRTVEFTKWDEERVAVVEELIDRALGD